MEYVELKNSFTCKSCNKLFEQKLNLTKYESGYKLKINQFCKVCFQLKNKMNLLMKQKELLNEKILNTEWEIFKLQK